MSVNVRYIVNSVDDAISFYTQKLGFELEFHPAPGFAALRRDNVKLYLNSPGAGGAGQSMPDGSVPAPGGWNRIQVEVKNLDDEVARLKGDKASFRNDIVNGQGGRQILLQDPSGNYIELFEPKKE
jgi:catechol 2,3-dioxygenase-like lactoylglutathione lyase family enzyme